MPSVFLLQEDSEPRQKLVRHLEKRGFAVECEVHGLDAFRMLRGRSAEQHPVAIIIDADLPQHSGYEISFTIKSHPRLVAIPIILLSAGIMGRGMSSALSAGPDEVCLKPLNMDILIDKIQKLVRTRSGVDRKE